MKNRFDIPRPGKTWFLSMAVSAALCTGLATVQAAPASKSAATPAATAYSPDTKAMLDWLRQSRDNAGSPFIVIDKRAARLWLFDAQGQAAGSTPILLGFAHGDKSVPGIGERPLEQVKPHEKTTPAGRFIAEPGRNAAGEDIFWIDYDAAVSMHRVRATDPRERRMERLASATPSDNRISFGCINVPADFYDQKIRPQFKGRRGVVYVIPETMPMAALFVPPPAPLGPTASAR